MSAGALTYGNESFVSSAINDQLKLRADYTYTIAQDLDTDTDLERRPQNKATLQADWIPIDKLHLPATALFVGAWHDINAETLRHRTPPPMGRSILPRTTTLPP
jgi:vitamin B12 transporter